MPSVTPIHTEKIDKVLELADKARRLYVDARLMKARHDKDPTMGYLVSRPKVRLAAQALRRASELALQKAEEIEKETAND